jgi:hypothetical protein
MDRLADGVRRKSSVENSTAVLPSPQQGSPTNRRYLSEPPLDYRQPAETAAKNDVGEDEWKKDKRRKAGYVKKDQSAAGGPGNRAGSAG